MKLRVIEGGRRNLENNLLERMSRGQISFEELDRLRPKGFEYRVYPSQKQLTENTGKEYPFDKTSS